MARESLSQMIERVRPSVVQIRTHSGLGTGVIFNTDGNVGYIVTNQHVVKDASEVQVAVNDSHGYIGLVLGTDDIFDLAVVKVVGGNFQAIPFGDSSKLKGGVEVVAIGYPNSYQGEATVTKGIVSGLRYSQEHRSEVIQSDVTIGPGNSGGPMLSISGEILGINTYVHHHSKGGNWFSFAIPEATVRTLASRLSVPVPPAVSQPSRQPRSRPATSPAQQTSASTRGFVTYLKSFGVGFIAGAVLGVVVANLALGIEGDLSATLIISGLVGGGLALFARMKIR